MTNNTVFSKQKIKFIHSLEQKKLRREHNAFVAEGHKSVGDMLLAGHEPLMIVATEEWLSPTPLNSTTQIMIVSEEELRKASLLQHPQQVIGIFPIPQNNAIPSAETLRKELVLCLDGVQDPGNLGTIIRTADWFGIKTIICSHDTADAYNPKVVQATMGSIARENIIYCNLPQYLNSIPADIPIYGTLLNGKPLYSAHITNNGIIVMGNEGNGISEEVRKLVTHKILIPPFPADNKTAESLNVAIATAIICAEFRRNG